MAEFYIELIFTFIILGFVIYAVFDGVRIFKRALNKRY